MVKIEKTTDFQNQGRYDEDAMKFRQLEEQITSLKAIIEEKEKFVEQLNRQSQSKHEEYQTKVKQFQ